MNRRENFELLTDFLSKITFENRFKYDLKLIWSESGPFELRVDRTLTCSNSGLPTVIGNGGFIPENATTKQLIDFVFERCGQFEAHEFTESFKFNGHHVYFPHDIGQDGLYGKSDFINKKIMKTFTFIVQDATHLDICLYWTKDWFKNNSVYKFLNDVIDGYVLTYQYLVKSVKTLFTDSYDLLSNTRREAIVNFKWLKKKQAPLSYAIARQDFDKTVQVETHNVEFVEKLKKVK